MNSNFVFLDLTDEELVKPIPLACLPPFLLSPDLLIFFFTTFPIESPRGCLIKVEDLARYISGLKKEEGENPPFVKDVLDLLSQKKTEEIADKFVSSSVILITAPAKELEGAFNLLICYLRKVKKEALHGLVLKLIDPFVTLALVGKVTHYLSILGSLYSQLESSNPTRYDVYSAILKYAAKQHRLQALQPGFVHVDQWLVEWGVDAAKKRALYLQIREALLAAEHPHEAHSFLIKYLATFETVPEAELASSKEQAVKAVTEAIDLADLFFVDQLVELKAINQLKGEPVHKLLSIFAAEGYKEYLEFHKANAGVVEKLGLSHERNLTKLKLVSLAVLAADYSEAIPYKTIALALEIDEADVEKWVVDAIRFKLIEAKLDQQKKLVTVSKTTFRVFADPQWKLLKQKLDAWRTSVNDVLRVKDHNAHAHIFGFLTLFFFFFFFFFLIYRW